MRANNYLPIIKTMKTACKYCGKEYDNISVEFKGELKDYFRSFCSEKCDKMFFLSREIRGTIDNFLDCLNLQDIQEVFNKEINEYILEKVIDS